MELAQRKFQRQVATIADKMELPVNFPRLFVLDFISEKEKQEMALKKDKELQDKEFAKNNERKTPLEVLTEEQQLSVKQKPLFGV